MESQKSHAKVDFLLGIALMAFLPFLDNGYLIALIVVIAILFAAAFILWFHDRRSTALWKRLVKIAGDIEIRYTALAVAFYGLGIAFLQNQWVLPGAIFLLVGAFFNGWGIMQPLAPLFKRLRGQAS